MKRFYSERMIEAHHTICRFLPRLSPQKAMFVFWKVKQSPAFNDQTMLGAQKRVISKRLVALNFNQEVA